MIDLKQWATDKQAEYIDAVLQYGSERKAAKSLGVARSTISMALASVRVKAAMKGYSPQHDMTRTVPDPFIVRGVSTFYNKEGKPSGQWVKSTLDEELREKFVKAMVSALSEEVRGLSPLTKPPEKTNADLLVVYPLGDPHFGMYAWSKEAGEDFDLAAAKRLTLGAVDRLLEASPPSDTCIILPLGDVFHMDDQTNQTPAHKNQLDADGRFVKVLGVGIQTFRHVVLRALERHKNVIVRFVPGNHDPHAIWALSFSIAAYFDNEPRVTVDLSPSMFWFYKFGSVLIGATHGDKIKHEQLPGEMACARPEDWGQTKHRYWYTGHVHRQSILEFPGVVCESFRTLAARDAWAAGHGYRAGRDMRSIIHHRDHGEIERHRCDIGMLEAAI
jgi:UDP-2,3-diacylglucosamine pyrophosphatase LpxH